MGWDGSGNVVRNTGTFQGSTAWQQTRDANRRIRADDHDTHDEDLATSIENTVARDGQNQPTTNLPMGGNRHTNCGEGAALTDYATLGQTQKSVTHVCTATGTGDAIILTPDIPPSAYAVAQKFVFYSIADNTGPVTVNVANLGAVAVKKRGGDDLEAGDIVTSEIVIIYYDGGTFQLSTLNNNTGVTAPAFTVNLEDDSTNYGPALRMSRKGATTTRLGALEYFGENDADPRVSDLQLAMRGDMLSRVAGSENSQFFWTTRVDGALGPRMFLAKGLHMNGATGGDPGAGGINAAALQENSGGVYSLVTNTDLAQVAIGASFIFDFGRADAHRVTLMFSNVAITNLSGGADDGVIQFGTASDWETVGYTSNSVDVSDTSNPATATNGFAFKMSSSAIIVTGRMVFSLIDPLTNLWVEDHNMQLTTTNGVIVGAGRKLMPGALTRLRVRTNGPETFSDGVLNVLVE